MHIPFEFNPDEREVYATLARTWQALATQVNSDFHPSLVAFMDTATQIGDDYHDSAIGQAAQGAVAVLESGPAFSDDPDGCRFLLWLAAANLITVVLDPTEPAPKRIAAVRGPICEAEARLR